ncbi:prephenate dehydrogenase [Neobacillus notoginsengisoli]|uniref:Prephenate dehydrogenase n=1 Tax=Neobacillus notoginsengisoli TaxID=1578198 RepID=A0A417YVM2_9BACI|nr:prephenate dehydrogenase [Neobacillus notoginsengisoli]RHW41252.1 prephenate dehydrogenase [Neobacillus notoginsengisoli]
MKGNVLVIGLGLIGGSLALSVKKAHPEAKVTGFDIKHRQAELAKLLGVIDEISETIEEGVVEADLIIISAPVRETARILKELESCSLKESVIITDTGSTKNEIARLAAPLTNKGICFIGGHPMAGSHKSGITAAKERLFENAFYILTPGKAEKAQNIAVLKDWLLGTNARFLELPPDEHDYLAGVISHFPHIIAASIVHQTEKLSGKYELLPRLAAGGFRDITRIASSSPEMWRDILLHNKNVLLDLLTMWQKEMDYVKELLEHTDEEAVATYFFKAKTFRDGLPANKKGAIPAFYDLFVDIPDYPGVISEITGYLANENISITNIRIIESREEIYGVLAISFQTSGDRDRAEKCIRSCTPYPMSYEI